MLETRFPIHCLAEYPPTTLEWLIKWNLNLVGFDVNKEFWQTYDSLTCEYVYQQRKEDSLLENKEKEDGSK